MKNVLFSFLAAIALISCSKTEFQQTTDTIKRADSLFTKANDGFRTLDSISKTIKDSNGIARKVIIPEIEKQKKAIDSTLKTGNYRIDSINKELEKITKNVKTGTEVVKTLDSANRSIQEGENPLVVLTRTADRILKQTKTNSAPNPTQETQPKSETQAQTQPQPRQDPVQNTVPASQEIRRNPLVKSGELEIKVDDLSNSKSLMQQQIRTNGGEIMTENFSSVEGIRKEIITVKVPLSGFDSLMNDMQRNLGDVSLKSTESEGTDYNPNQMCDIRITLVQNENIATIPPVEEAQQNDKTFGSESSGAFMKGFDVLKNIVVWMLPFWPLLIIGLLVWYFLNKRNKKRRNDEEMNAEIPQQHFEQTSSAPKVNTEYHAEAETTDSEDPYEKYKPK